MGESVLRKKSFDFSLRIISLCKVMRNEKVEYVLCNQLVRSGTAIGALAREAEFAQSRADFINKLSIALKEANETIYWLDILRGSMVPKIPDPIQEYQMVNELKGMLISSIKTAKANQKK